MAKKKTAKRKKRTKRARKLKFRLTIPQLATAIEMLSDKRKHELLDRAPELERTMRFRWLDEVSKRRERALRKKAKRSASKAGKAAKIKKGTSLPPKKKVRPKKKKKTRRDKRK